VKSLFCVSAGLFGIRHRRWRIEMEIRTEFSARRAERRRNHDHNLRALRKEVTAKNKKTAEANSNCEAR